MNLSTELFVLCDYATISREQKLSVIGIFDQFFVANVPTTWPKMFLVAVISGAPNSENDVTLKISPPASSSKASGEGGAKNNQNLPNKDLKLTLGPNGRANLITELVNFPLPLVGSYKVEILQEGKTVSVLNFKVNKTTATYSGDQLGKKVVN